MKLKIPKLTIKRPGFLTRKQTPSKSIKLPAATARMRPAVDDDFDDEPQTRLSSAFFVVLILHVVAVGGIYAFNSIKAHRRGLEPAASTTPAAKPAAAKPVAAEPAPSVAPEPAPVAKAPPTTAAAPSASPQLPTTPVSNTRVYHVKQGDTLTKISQQTGVSVAALQFANRDTATLRPGQVLNIPAKTAVQAPSATIEPPAPNPTTKKTESATKSAAAAATAKTYEVQKGDTATSIARKFGVSADELLKLNKIADPTKLRLGAKLSIPAKKN